MINKLGLFLLLFISCDLIAGVDVVNFSDESLRPRYQQLIQELRCPKCQNQNLADSNSPISVDLRNQVQRLLEEGKSNDEIKTYLSDRYSDFILYRPQVKKNTWALWIAPIVLLLVGLLILYRIFQRQKTTAPYKAPVSSQDQERLRELLKDTNGDSN
ncbi:MAG: cytochrome c-type biogenesis protein [Porticoccaceae bacterium]